MHTWTTEAELFHMARQELYAAVIGDVLDQMGHTRQFLPADIRPVAPNMIIAGRVLTVRGMDVAPDDPIAQQDPYGLLFEALDALGRDDVFLYSGGRPEYAIWGGLMSTRAQYLHAAGAVIDGCYRDSKEILELQFPTFARCAYAPDQKGRGIITDYRCDLQIGDVRISNGDYIFGDRDGVVIIPTQIGAAVFTAAFDKVRTENQLRIALEGGMSARAAFDKYGIF